MTAHASRHLRLAFYGDDFTGSTDALESLTRAGVRTGLFLEPPTPERLRSLPGLEAVGIAGLTRSLGPEEMEATLRPAFTAIRALGPRHVHYKVCSTFDSSPTVGSIGRAIDVGREIFAARYVPLVVAAPALGRYCVFGNLFARYGIGSAGAIHRLDRHPAMSRHPVTPADESDLRLHLARQTKRRIELIDILQLEGGDPRSAVDRLVEAGAEIVLFDAIADSHLREIGRVLETESGRSAPLFTVGSSGVGAALGAEWASAGAMKPRVDFPAAREVDRLLVVSGSCSPVTGDQIDWALSNGFAGVALDPHSPRTEEALREAGRALRDGRSVIVHTSRGGASGPVADARIAGTALGRIARELVAQHSLARVAVAGGDSSSYAGRAMGVEVLEMIAPLAPGAPLCRAHAPGSAVDGIELNFKGGQVGSPDYFGAVRRGTL